MSRTIKFRAWTGKTMMYQDKQYLGSFLRRVVMQVMLDHGSDEPREHESYLPKGKSIDDYLMQWTGLVDRNGKEIYEGDLVRRENNHGAFVITWDDGGFYRKYATSEGGIAGVDAEQCEVIGSIYGTAEE